MVLMKGGKADVYPGIPVMGKPKTVLHSLSAASTPKKAVFSAVKPDGIVFFW